jgi:hypothetical protein
MTINFPTLIISRRPRHLGESWNDARSWFGGKPQLGEQAWARVGAQQRPLFFVAQIDLPEVAREVQRFVKMIYDFRQNPKKYLTIKFELFK